MARRIDNVSQQPKDLQQSFWESLRVYKNK